jgi:hypothetical protein
MRSTLTKSLIGALAVVLLSAGAASAADVLHAKVPFPFVVNGHSFSAGQYTIERAESSPSVFLIRGENGKATTAAFVATRPADHHAPASEMPALQFKKSENEYKLSAVWESPSDGRTVID